MSTLRVDLADDFNVRISHSDCSVSDWRRTVLFWKRGDLESEPYDEFLVELYDFAHRLLWLRDEWKSTSENHHFSLTDEVKARVRQLQNDAAEFDRLAQLGPPDTVGHLVLNFIRPLNERQLLNVVALLRMKNGANFSVPGAGKTATELAVWDVLRSREEIKGLLVVCPKSAFSAWSDETSYLFVNPPKTHIFNGGFIPASASIILVNYEQLENHQKVQSLRHWIKNNRALLVLDEAHRVKAGSSAVRWLACKQLAEIATRTDLLTGTPMPQSYEDLRNLFSLSWKGVSRNHFNEARLRSIRRGGVFVRTTKAELELPPMTTVPVEIEMGELQRQVYDALRFSYAGQLQLSATEEMHFARKGRAIMTLLAAATNPGLILGRNSEDAYLELKWPPKELPSNLVPALSSYVSHEIPSKYQWIQRFIQNAANENRKVLVWSTFVGNLQSLQRLLRPFSPAIVYGSISADQRLFELDRFRKSSNCSVLLTNPQTLGEGISLHHECHDAVYLDRSYNAGLYLQSLDRIHRLGLDPHQETRVYLLESSKSIDQRVSTRLATKIANLGSALDDVGLLRASLPNDVLTAEEISGMDSFDYADLVAHLRDD
jgi:SNF2 family DNA or RNA helicase